MDNITHSLIGIALGRTRKIADARSAAAAFWISVIGNNLPDFDFLARYFVSPGKVAYMLHHRGYTHTLAGILLLGVLATASGALIARMNLRQAAKFLPLGWLACALHVFSDSWNEYGVHPFFPFSSEWFYGDFIFIIEPWIWVALLPFAAFASHRSWVKWVWSAVAAALLSFGVYLGALPAPILISLILGFGFSAWIQRERSSARHAWAGLAAVLLVFLGASIYTRKSVVSAGGLNRADERVQQLALSPAPGNPFCWRFVSSSISSSGEYLGRLGTYSWFPKVFPPQICHLRSHSDERTAPLGRLRDGDPSPHLDWVGMYRGSVTDLERLRGESCQFAQFLRYSRNPFWVEMGDDSVAGDLRYDREPGLGFTEFLLGPGQEPCLDAVPPWKPPIDLTKR